jgi:S-adenosylmethionine decarboxylase
MGESVDFCGYFEGPEKLLEVWFKVPQVHSQASEDERWGLRSVDRKVWDEMLALVKCNVLNVSSSRFFDGYVLSESSMFVWNTKLVLKTCGTTTLLKALPRLLTIAKEVGFEEVENLFFSRRNFLYPEKQLSPHSSFNDEVRFLDEHFDGSAFVLGRVNGEHWYLYMTERQTEEQKRRALAPDQTLEILMTGLDPEAVKPFFKIHSASAKEATQRSGIGNLVEGAVCDDYLFDPCGYSVNGLLDDGYFTIHVTPQSSCSYASFETNINMPSYDELIKKVIAVFRPGHFSVSLFSNQPVSSISEIVEGWTLEGYEKRDKTFYQFEIYNLSYMSQHKLPACKSSLLGTQTALVSAENGSVN